MNLREVDISETWLRDKYPEAFNTLLRCHSSYDAFRRTLANKEDAKGHEDEYHIIWATDDYIKYGEGYGFHDMITADKITGESRGMLIRPRAVKTADEQARRVKDKAEVFTPSWICNAQNNLVDEAWFGRKDVFNVETVNPDGSHSWRSTLSSIEFPEGKTWQDYVKDIRLEMCCGEAPYLVSRYDTVTGHPIPVNERIGLLDRKMRVINENVDDKKEWRDWAKIALQSIYGFEWQGDSLLIARESVLYTILDFYKAKFGEEFKTKDTAKSMASFAYIISWNIWQMDGLKMVVPESCGEKPEEWTPMFVEPKILPCEGCKTGDHSKHNGIKCRIRDWRYNGKDEKKQRPYFFTLLNNPLN